jgi:hypothetical protein
MEPSAGITARGHLKCQVVDARTRRVVRDHGWQKNLILNQGLDMVAVRPWADCFTNAAAGTGTPTLSVDPAPTLLSQNGVVLTLSGGAFVFTDTATDAGKTVKWISGQEAVIVSVDSPTQARVADAKTIFPAKSFKIFSTNETGLQSEVGRNVSYFTGEFGCGTTLSSGTGVVTLRRSLDFAPEVGSITYTEVGLSHTGSAGANLFAEILLQVPVLVNPGQFLRVIYDLQLGVAPVIPFTRNASISGWVASGFDVLETWGLMGVDSNGLTAAIQTYASVVDVDSNEPSADTWVVVGEDTTAPLAFGSAPINRFIHRRRAQTTVVGCLYSTQFCSN